ncbi:hypothetical protein ACGFIF_12950 [Kribbella sp. NPDC049174]|uniref:hypothetical protein n=1 Tax=Kribbella sp. NPDC049174 TaxID=3364112 RepID=UPI00371B6A76
MFENDLTVLSMADLLESAAAHRAEVNRLDARLLEHAQIFADHHHPDTSPTRPGRRSSDGRERAVVLGGDGCPAIAEFAPAEFGVMVGMSPGVAADYIGQALALRHRLPLTWARVQAGEATPWKARKIATACLDLPEDATRAVDQRVARVVDLLTPIRLDKIVEAAKKHADPENARAKAEAKNRERGVYLGRCDEHGTKKIFIRTGSGRAIRFNARIGSIAEALKILGDTASLQSRRADAVGIIADPRYTEELLHQAHEYLRNAPPGPPAPTDNDSPTAEAATDAGAARAPAVATGQDMTPGAGVTNDHSTAKAADRGGPPVPGRGGTSTGNPVRGAASGRRTTADEGHGPYPSDQSLLDDWPEPGLDDEADRDAPHPSHGDVPGPLDTPYEEVIEPFDPSLRLDRDDSDTLHTATVNAAAADAKATAADAATVDAAARHVLDARLAQIRHDAHTKPRTGRQLRPGQTEIYVHLTDHTLATGTGVLRVEDVGPLLASQLSELVGHGPYTVKPVIDLHDAVSVDAYEIPDRIRERVKLLHPVELFPYGTRETHRAMDLDHIQPYDPLGPPGQTSTDNLAPLGRFPHRVKTHGRGWNVRRLDHKTLRWTTPNGFMFHVDPTGTHRAPNPLPDI